MRSMIQKILLIEQSEIIQNGLLRILSNTKKLTIDIVHYSDDANCLHVLKRTSYDIIIVSPDTYKTNKKHFIKVKQQQNAKLVGLVYSYHHPDSLSDFDALIHLDDKAISITSTLTNLIEPLILDQESTSEEILSVREVEVLKWLASGYTTKEIASKLFISIHTVNAHRKNIMSKLEIKTSPGLTIYAVLNNIISIKDR